MVNQLIQPVFDFNLKATLESGQVFGFERLPGGAFCEVLKKAPPFFCLPG